MATGDPDDAVVVVGDFNTPPQAPSHRRFVDAGFVSLAGLAEHPAPTYQFYGIRLRCLDDIILSPDCRVRQHQVVELKPGNTYPSDHFGVLADIALSQDIDSHHPVDYIQTN
jgi:endonuclease/exonuclease/phosphatase family metal-dependent hydrolase